MAKKKRMRAKYKDKRDWKKVSNRGEWMRQKWKVRRGWIEVVILGSIHGDIIDIIVGNEKSDERAAGRRMLRKNRKKIKKVLMDGLHDCEDTFKTCERLGIETGIKIRENASNKGLGRRAEEVRLYRKLGYKRWAKQKEYGLRWSEGRDIFGGEKNIWGMCSKP